MSAVADTRGLKRICADCGARFYDLNKRPIICPSCAVEFSGEIKVKSRRGRLAAIPEDTAIKPADAEALKATAQKDDELEEDDDGTEIVSLEDLETVDQSAGDDNVDPDLSVDEDSDDDLPDLGDDDLDGLDDLDVEEDDEEEGEASA